MYDCPSMEPLKTAWDLIDEIALDNEVTTENLRKWHERGKVPPKWHAALVEGFNQRGVVVDLKFFSTLATPDRPERRRTKRAA